MNGCKFLGHSIGLTMDKTLAAVHKAFAERRIDEREDLSLIHICGSVCGSGSWKSDFAGLHEANCTGFANRHEDGIAADLARDT